MQLTRITENLMSMLIGHWTFLLKPAEDITLPSSSAVTPQIAPIVYPGCLPVQLSLPGEIQQVTVLWVTRIKSVNSNYLSTPFVMHRIWFWNCLMMLWHGAIVWHHPAWLSSMGVDYVNRGIRDWIYRCFAFISPNSEIIPAMNLLYTYINIFLDGFWFSIYLLSD